jgi:DNA polymerase-3 subunit gamma/tau
VPVRVTPPAQAAPPTPVGGTVWPSAAVPGAPEQVPDGRSAGPAVAPAGPATQDGPPSGGLDAAALRRAWDTVLLAVKEQKKTAWVQLMNCQVLSVSGRTLTLSFAQGGPMRAFQSGPSPEILRDALRETLGADLDIACVVGTGRAHEPAPGQAADRAQRPGGQQGAGPQRAGVARRPATATGGDGGAGDRQRPAGQPGAAGPTPPAPAAAGRYDGFAPGDEVLPDDPDAPEPPPRVSGEDAALLLVQSELGGRVVGTLGE